MLEKLKLSGGKNITGKMVQCHELQLKMLNIFD